MTGDGARWQLVQLAIDIGELLGLPLDVARGGPGVYLGTDSYGLHLAGTYNRPGRVTVTRRWPWPTTYSFKTGERKTITAAISRGAPEIAGDIRARLIPGYQDVLDKIAANDEQDRKDDAARDRLTGLITGLFPDEKTRMPDHWQTHHSAQVTIYLPGHQGGTAKVNRDGSEVEFDRFRVPAHVALRMLETAALLVSATPQETTYA